MTSDELEALIELKKGNSLQTIKNYRVQYKVIIRNLKKTIIEATEEEILKAVLISGRQNLSSEWVYLNIPFMIREIYGLPNGLIQKRRSELKLLKEEHIKEQKELKRDELPSHQEIQRYIKELYEKQDYKRYVVNYLILHYGVRNKDVNVFIVASKHDTIDNKKNYLIVKPNEVIWIRNDYKTVSTYGVQEIVIKAQSFIVVMKSFPLNTWLLNGSSQKLNESGLATVIKRLLYNNLTEGDYFKINMDNINTKSNTTKMLEYFSKTRGTDYSTLLKYYDLSKSL